jgi:predicted MFS family arabinose efflux permease
MTPSDERGKIETPQAPYAQRNYVLGVANGALYMLAESLVDSTLVLTWFLARLSAANVLIGLVVPLRDAGWFLPQLFVAPYLSRQSRQLPTYNAAALVRGIAWATMAIVLLTQREPAILIAGFFIPYVINSFASGWAGLSFMEVVAKTIPAERRGSYFGSRMLLGGLLGLAGSLVVRLALSEQLGRTFPANVGQLMAIAGVCAMGGLLAFAWVREPPGEVSQVASFAALLGRAANLPGRDRNFTFFLGARVLLMAAQMATPFLAVYASRELGARAEMVSVYLAANTGAALVSNLGWSRLADQRGNRAVIRLAALLGLTMALTAWLAGPVSRVWGLGLAAPWLFALVFALVGAFQAGISLGGMSLLLELAPPAERRLYVGLANTVLGIALLSTSIGGVLVDWLGYRGLFLLAAGCYAAGLWTATRLREPRRVMQPR